MLNQGVIHTYFTWNKCRRRILIGSPDIVSKRNIIREYCNKLIRR
jgi:hypothetical protein